MKHSKEFSELSFIFNYCDVLCAVLTRSVVSDSAIPWTAAHQAPLSMGFSRQEYWSRLPCPSPGDFPNPGIEPRSSSLQADSLLSKPPRKPLNYCDKNPEHEINPLHRYLHVRYNIVKYRHSVVGYIFRPYSSCVRTSQVVQR